ncbi:hypothetical protein ACJ41O_012729 [Fusarium nematophilum]
MITNIHPEFRLMVEVIVGAAIQAACYSYAQMFVARIIAGVGIGLSTVAVPILQSETLPANNRGALLVVQSTLIVVGISIASWVCLGTLYAQSSMQWRFPIIFSAIVLVLCLWLPESPRWTAKTGNVEEARRLLSRILDEPLGSEEVEQQLSEILKFLKLEEEAGEAKWHELFRNNTKSRNLQRVLLGMGPYLMNQWSGINSLSYYLGFILQTFLGYSQVVSLVLAGVAFTQCALFSTLPYFFIDRTGRRNTIMFSSGACAICLAVISGSLLKQRYSDAAAAVAFMFLYLDCYVLGFLPVSWSYSAEIQPLRVRNKATAVGVFSHWISNFVVVMVTPIGIEDIGGNFFWIWAVICALFVPVAYIFGVETSGRTLEEVDQMFFDEPRILMGLNQNHRRVIQATPGSKGAKVRAIDAQGDRSEREIKEGANFKVVVVGGGPVGLVAAHALYNAGIDFVVLERRENVVLDLGASLVLSPPNLRVMHQLGLLERLMEIGSELLNTKGFLLNGSQFKQGTELQLLKDNHGIGLVAFHRAHLVKVLFDGLPDEAKARYLLNKRVTDINSKDEGVIVTCDDGSTYDGSIVFGTDGVHSITRNIMRSLALSDNPRLDWDARQPFTTEYKCLWCSFPRPSAPGENFETTSKDQAAMYLTGRERGWILLYDKDPEPTSALRSYSDEDVEAFAAKFAHIPVNETLTVRDVFERRLTCGMSDLGEGIVSHWSWGRIVLAGDACHKFTPNAGLGLNNGIQDIVVLCNELHKAINAAPNGQPGLATLEEALRKYQEDRSELVEKDYKQSAMVTRLQTWANGVYYFLSRFVLRYNFVARFIARFVTSPILRKGRVLDYAQATELPFGRVTWEHEIWAEGGKPKTSCS